MRPEQYLSNTTAPLRAFHSLSDEQAGEFEAGLALLPGAWELDRQEGYDGHLTLLFSPADAACDVVFAVWRAGAELQLSTMRGDEPVAVEGFGSVRAVLLAIRDSVRRTGAPFALGGPMRLV
ncbi:hypothetical protein EAH89_07565 [Roseomonas nepalensis]|uniref:Uncharacterized protein n=1 Tax=Muricoccus nepalensis TaxID=1854500 RepID=A0A502GCN3_9PROT|nr:hypothetical protein [Roseomonas nepalensis]TPG58463.1 hypothetical protein EAH89_07565 [Roseomonas nepalensis]